MKALRIKKRLWIKPRICPECDKFCLLAENYASVRCTKCHRHRKHVQNRAKLKAKFGNRRGKYTSSYMAARKKAILKQPYCSLCGSTECLTTHHIGGGTRNDRLTVLCDECHQAYERWNNKGRPNARQRLVQKQLRVLQVRLQSTVR